MLGSSLSSLRGTIL